MTTFTLRAEPASMGIVFFMTGHTGRREDDARVRRRRMTVMASESFVAAVQREAGAGVMIEVPDFPISRVVADVAPDPQLSTMDIVACVTSVAAKGRFVSVEDPFVATVARDRTMLAEQGIGCVAIVLEAHGFPVLFEMTAFACLAEPTLMFVVFPMAGIAVARSLVPVEYAGVATVAFRRSVRAFQTIGGIAIVFEEHGFPAPFGMTALACFAEPAFVLIVFLVAGVTVDGRVISVEVSLVAGRARSRSMLAS